MAHSCGLCMSALSKQRVAIGCGAGVQVSSSNTGSGSLCIWAAVPSSNASSSVQGCFVICSQCHLSQSEHSGVLVGTIWATSRVVENACASAVLLLLGFAHRYLSHCVMSNACLLSSVGYLQMVSCITDRSLLWCRSIQSVLVSML